MLSMRLSAPILMKSLLIASLLSGCSSINDRFNQARYSDDYELAFLSDHELRSQGSEWEYKYRSNPENPIAAVGYSQYLRHLEESENAIKIMRLVTIKHPQDPGVLKEYGKALLQAGQFATALNAFERGRSPVNADWDLLNNMGVAYDHLGDNAKAMDVYKQALSLNPDEPRILANMGMSFALAGDIRSAESYLSQAVSHPKATRKIHENYALIQSISTKVAANPEGLPTLSPSETAAAVLSYLPQNNTGFVLPFNIIESNF